MLLMTLCCICTLSSVMCHQSCGHLSGCHIVHIHVADFTHPLGYRIAAHQGAFAMLRMIAKVEQKFWRCH